MCILWEQDKCWNQLSDEQLETEWVKCGYDDYVLDEAIELEDLLQESARREEEKQDMELGRNAG